MSSTQRQIPSILVALLFVIAIVNGLADANHWYWTMRWFDMPMHFSGGVWLSGMALWWVYFRKDLTPQGFYKILAVSVAFAFGVGLLWELYEAVVGLLTVGHANALSDTLSDLFFDILGGVAVSGLVWVRSK